MRSWRFFFFRLSFLFIPSPIRKINRIISVTTMRTSSTLQYLRPTHTMKTVMMDHSVSTLVSNQVQLRLSAAVITTKFRITALAPPSISTGRAHLTSVVNSEVVSRMRSHPGRSSMMRRSIEMGSKRLDGLIKLMYLFHRHHLP